MLHCTACSACCLRPACAEPGDVGTDVTTGTSACRQRTGTVGRRQRIPLVGQRHSRHCPSRLTARMPCQTTGRSTKTKRWIHCSRRWKRQLNNHVSLNQRIYRRTATTSIWFVTCMWSNSLTWLETKQATRQNQTNHQRHRLRSNIISGQRDWWIHISLVASTLLPFAIRNDLTAAVAEWLRAWDTLTMFEATVCGSPWVRSPTGAI